MDVMLLHRRFEAQAAVCGDRVAVSHGADSITYRELDDRAESVAAALRSTGATPGAFVGICVHRGITMIAGILGILKAGAAYVPIDPTYPPGRVEFLLRDSTVSTVVAVERTRQQLRTVDVSVLLVDDEHIGPGVRARGETGRPAEDVGRSAVAYVIYTSGSTGTPKGVVVEQHSVISLFERTKPMFGFSADDVWTLFHSMSFDFSVWEMWGALLHGGRLVVIDSAVARTPGQLRELLLAEHVTVLSQTPSSFTRLIAADLAQPRIRLPLRHVVLGGERLDLRPLEPWLQRHGDTSPQIHNMYGITETTVHVTHRRITMDDLATPAVSPIGAPIPGMLIRLLDEDGAPVPDGTPGEIHVGGPGVARGYHRRAALTSERFRTVDRDGRAERLYRSGDRAVRTGAGEYHYLGRVDDQIKVRGFRIEPAEIETLLSTHPQVERAVVVSEDHDDGDVRLSAHVVTATGATPADVDRARIVAELRRLVADRLPAYMWPSSYRLIHELPITSAGKVDRAALGGGSHRTDLTGDAPGDGAPPAVVGRIAADVLAHPDIGADDDMFTSGATSLAFVRIIALVNARYQTAITWTDLDRPTVRAISTAVERGLS